MEIDNIYNMDCLEGMTHIPDGSVDLIVTDPPYEFVGDSGNFGKRAGNLLQPYQMELQNAGIISGFQREQIMKECIRIMKKVNIYIWCSKAQLLWYLDFFKDYNMDLLTWHKPSVCPTCNNKYLSDTEYLLYFREKGAYLGGTCETKKKWFLQYADEEDKKLWQHPTIKPLNIIQTLIINSSKEGEVICDPFMGSGTTAVACIKEKRHFIGFELNEEYWKKACQRIDAEQRQLKLF